MNIPPVRSIPQFRPGERQDGGTKSHRQAREKAAEASGKPRRLTERLPSDDYDGTQQKDGSDLGRHTDQTV